MLPVEVLEQLRNTAVNAKYCGEVHLSQRLALELEQKLAGSGWKLVPAAALSQRPADKPSSEALTQAPKLYPEDNVKLQRLIKNIFCTGIGKPLFERIPHINEVRARISQPIPLRLSASSSQHFPLTRNSAEAQNYKDLMRATAPHLTIVPPKQILIRLRKETYGSVRSAEAEVLQYLLACQRYYPPGSTHWLYAHRVAQEVLRVARILKISFELPMHFSAPRPAHRSPNCGQRAAPPPPPRFTSSIHRNLKRRMRFMKPELMERLKEEFKNDAKWKFDSDLNKMSLDINATDPETVLKIFNWCTARVTVFGNSMAKSAASANVAAAVEEQQLLQAMKSRLLTDSDISGISDLSDVDMNLDG